MEQSNFVYEGIEIASYGSLYSLRKNQKTVDTEHVGCDSRKYRLLAPSD